MQAAGVGGARRGSSSPRPGRATTVDANPDILGPQTQEIDVLGTEHVLRDPSNPSTQGCGVGPSVGHHTGERATIGKSLDETAPVLPVTVPVRVAAENIEVPDEHRREHARERLHQLIANGIEPVPIAWMAPRGRERLQRERCRSRGEAKQPWRFGRDARSDASRMGRPLGRHLVGAERRPTAERSVHHPAAPRVRAPLPRGRQPCRRPGPLPWPTAWAQRSDAKRTHRHQEVDPNRGSRAGQACESIQR